MPRLFRATMLVSAVSAALVLFGLAPANAGVPLSGVVSATPVPWTPNVLAGTTSSTVCQQWFAGPCSAAIIQSTAIVNGEVVVAGRFTKVCQPGSPSGCQPGTLVTRDDIFAYQLGTGTIDPTFKPQLDKGPVYAVAAGPNNTVYVGGAFGTVNGETNNKGVVQLSVTPGVAGNGKVVAAFKGNVNNKVFTLAYNGNALYVGGEWVSVDGKPGTGIARLNAATGALDASFHISISNPVTVGGKATALKVNDMSLSAVGTTLAITGTFTKVSGFPATRLALINTGGALGAAASVANWAAPIMKDNCAPEHDWARGVDISPDGSFLVLAATGFHSATTSNYSVCDATARFPTAATGTNIAPAWINYTGGDSFYSVQVTGAVVYVGGHNRWVNNECGNDSSCEANSVLVMGLAAIDANTGLAIPWFHPMTTRGEGVMSLTAFPAGQFTGSNGGLLLGDGVADNGGPNHSFEALFPLTSTTASPTFGSIRSGIFLQGRLGGFDESTAGVAAMCVDDTGNSSTPGTKVEFSTCTNGADQNWTVQSGGTITINGLCLDTSGTSVVVNTCSGSTSQNWTQGPGNTLVNQASGQCLDDPGSSTTNGTVLDVATCTSGAANQVWPLPAAPIPPSLTPAGAISASVPVHNAQPACIADTNDSTTPGTAAEMLTCIDDQSQNASINSNGTIQIQGLCLDTSGSNVVFNTCSSGSSSQVWTPGTGHTLVNQASGQCLEATSQSVGAGLIVTGCASANVNQQWWLPAV